LLIAAFKESSIINYSYPLLEYLGKISYGVYLFHLFAIIIAIKFLEAIGMPLYEFRTLMVLITCSCVLAILFGMLSYHTIETFFLRFKKSFDFKRPVKSAENPKEIT
jgi:peptidoglycan/LPS O-acetylase OafA/YrhL